jgi:hypothetical protein
VADGNGQATTAREAATMWVVTQDLPRTAGHPFCARLHQILDKHDFDEYVEERTAKVVDGLFLLRNCLRELDDFIRLRGHEQRPVAGARRLGQPGQLQTAASVADSRV